MPLRSMGARLVAVAALVALLSHATPALAPRPPAIALAGHGLSAHAEQLSTRLQATLDRQRRAIGIPGVTATIVFADGSRWSGGSGYASLGPPASATPATPFVIGSITKTFVAALIMQLAEEGLLDLGDRLSRWLPDYPRAASYSLRQLLSHTSGVHNYFEHGKYNRSVFGGRTSAWTPDEILATFRRAPYFAPGAGYHYSNTGYVLLGRVAEQATGTPLAELLSARFTQPLDLRRASFQGAGAPPASTARGYLRAGRGFTEITDWTGYRPTRSAATVAWAAGDGVSTADDIATWARSLYGGDVLDAQSLADMLDYSRYPRARYGLGVQTRKLDGRRMFGHTGSLRGYVAAMWHLPEEGVTVVVMANRGRINPNALADALLRQVLSASLPPGRSAGVTVVTADSRLAVPGAPPARFTQPSELRY